MAHLGRQCDELKRACSAVLATGKGVISHGRSGTHCLLIVGRLVGGIEAPCVAHTLTE